LKKWLVELFKTSDFEIIPASEDASFRSYYRVLIKGTSYIVMDAPPEHENSALFVEISNKLGKSGVNVPVIFNKDIKQGFLLITDFGNDLYLDKLNQSTVETFYNDAIRSLVRIQVDADVTGLGLYDEILLREEINLFFDWLLQRHLKINLDEKELNDLNNITDLLVKNAMEQPRVFVHRDYHSRNLMLCDKDNPGIIDYQDAVLGPISYDLVSLLKDCYIKWKPGQIDRWVNQYLDELHTVNPAIKINNKQFQKWFDLMGVQRHLKASGIFARLCHRDGKCGFLNDIPRTLSYIVDLKHDYPELDTLILVIEKCVLPQLEKN
ncbi:MAG: phosphotransferase, partial [Proteobacteria bacterium]|nr:phosphotransferase [Pseudomonadota bacterium]